MDPEVSARLALPLLRPGQAQKEVFHNEALALLDIAAQANVAAVGLNLPPITPLEGQCWVVGAMPSDAWADHPGAIAGWTAGGWRFIAPMLGMTVWSEADGVDAQYLDGVWTIGDVRARRLIIAGDSVVGARQPAIADPSGGTIIDDSARAAITGILAALRTHGLIAA